MSDEIVRPYGDTTNDGMVWYSDFGQQFLGMHSIGEPLGAETLVAGRRGPQQMPGQAFNRTGERRRTPMRHSTRYRRSRSTQTTHSGARRRICRMPSLCRMSLREVMC